MISVLAAVGLISVGGWVYSHVTNRKLAKRVDALEKK